VEPEPRPNGSDLVEVVERTGARGELAAALAKAKLAFKPITARHTAKIDSEKGSYTYTYADQADQNAATLEGLSANGLAIVQPLDVADGFLWVVTRLLHTGGAEIVSHVPIAPLDRLAGQRPQALGSLITYMRRYAYAAMLGLAVEDDDGAAAEAAARSRPEGPTRSRRSATPPASPGASPPPSSSSTSGASSAKPPRLDQVSEDQVRRFWIEATDVAARMQVSRELVEVLVRRWLADLGLESTKDLTPPAYNSLRRKLSTVTLTDLAGVKRAQATAPESAPEDPPPPADGEAPCPFD
jgi:hypothetical protein